jgi:PTS system mannose-specific IID component/fructoselysine and glucoselysine-specific PTS system IID component
MKFILRKFKESDLASLVKYANNYNIAKFLTNMFPHPYTEENGKDYLSLAINHPGIFAIDVDGEVVGSIGLFPQTDIHQKSAELGYWLAEPFWGNGIVPQAIGEIVEYGFKTFDIVRIYARPFSTNRASQRVLEKAASMEEQNANSEEGEFQTESISMIKTSLMGPFAGIGDSFFQGTIRIITFGIGLSFAQQGSILGPILAVLLFAIPSLLFAYNATFFGYRSGNKYLAKLYQEGLMDRVMHFASIVGLAVVGGMVASMVSVTTPLTFSTGGTNLVIQDMLDSIIPKMLPFVFTLGIYNLVQKKVNTNVLLIGIVLFGMVMGALGIL